MNRDKLGIIYTDRWSICDPHFYSPVTHHPQMQKTSLIPIKTGFSTKPVNQGFTALFHRYYRSVKIFCHLDNIIVPIPGIQQLKPL